MKKILMLTSFDLPRLRPSLREAAPTTPAPSSEAEMLRLNSAQVAQLSITQLVERSRSVS
ncbi:hypothetical protein [Nostoc sp.]|uniref:hypothetical protein n=1 Tax=Nostoc sp. TaxID=1180 RepID=UPI002FF8BA77